MRKMRNKKLSIFYILCLFLTISSCSEKKTPRNEDRSIRKIRYKNIEFKKHELKGFDSSGTGKILINKDKLLFADELFNVIYECDLNGDFKKIVAEKGKGPRDIAGCGYFIESKDGYILTTKNWIVSEMSNNWERKNLFSINFPLAHSLKEVRNNPSCEYIGIYELDIFCKNICEFDNDHLLIPITTEHFKLNGYGTNSEEYYKNSYILGIVNKEKGIVEKMIGHRPDVYRKNKYIPNFNWFSFTIIKNEIIVSFAADPKIYVLNKKGENLYKYGFSGKNMKIDYKCTTNPNIALKNTQEDFIKYDYYNSIKYIKETGLLFRTYKNRSKDHDGMQIYKDCSLIADIEVPKNFRISGYANGVYYAQGESINDIISFYTFKL